MHKSQESAGQPVSASSSAAPQGQPAQVPGAPAPVWLAPLLHEIAHHALNARGLLGHLLDAGHDGPDGALTVATSNVVSMIGMLADTGLSRLGESVVMGDPPGWLLSPTLSEALAAAKGGAA